MKKYIVGFVIGALVAGSSFVFSLGARAVTTQTVTIYPDTGKPGAVSVDGDFGTNDSLTFPVTSANCTDCSSSGVITTENSVGQINGVNHYSTIHALMNFNTSVIPAGATIVSATVSVKPQATHFDFTANQNEFVRLVSNSIASNNNYQLNDYNSLGTVALSNDFAVNSMSSGTYVDYPLNGAGLAQINRTGVSHFGIRLGGDINNAIPVAGTDVDFPDRGGAVVFFNSSEAGTSSSPKLVVTYTIPSTPTPTPTPTPTVTPCM